MVLRVALRVVSVLSLSFLPYKPGHTHTSPRVAVGPRSSGPTVSCPGAAPAPHAPAPSQGSCFPPHPKACPEPSAPAHPARCRNLRNTTTSEGVARTSSRAGLSRVRRETPLPCASASPPPPTPRTTAPASEAPALIARISCKGNERLNCTQRSSLGEVLCRHTHGTPGSEAPVPRSAPGRDTGCEESSCGDGSAPLPEPGMPPSPCRRARPEPPCPALQGHGAPRGEASVPLWKRRPQTQSRK